MCGYAFEILLVLVVIVKAMCIWEGYHSESLPITFLIPIFFSRPCFLLCCGKKKMSTGSNHHIYPPTISTHILRFLLVLPIYSAFYLFTCSYKWVIFPSPLSCLLQNIAVLVFPALYFITKFSLPYSLKTTFLVTHWPISLLDIIVSCYYHQFFMLTFF